jgi:hypothetical protein
MPLCRLYDARPHVIEQSGVKLQFGYHLSATVRPALLDGRVRSVVNRPDPREERLVGPGPSRERPRLPRVEPAGGDAQPPAHGGHAVRPLVRPHELESLDGSELVSRANQAAAASRRMSRSSRRALTSRRRRRTSSRSSVAGAPLGLHAPAEVLVQPFARVGGPERLPFTLQEELRSL